MKNAKRIVMFIVCMLAYNPSIYSAIHLIGIYNKLPNSYQVSVKGGHANVETTAEKPVPMDITLPATVIVKEPGQTIGKEITIKPVTPRGNCVGYGVQATVAEYVDTGNTVCVPSSTIGYLPGVATDAFQSVVLAIWPVYSKKSNELQFDFAVSAWSSTRFPWSETHVYSPSDNQSIRFSSETAAEVEKRIGKQYESTSQVESRTKGDPKANPAPQEIPAKDRNGLLVLQGYSAWGGGITPRLYHANIVHIYNDTPNGLIVRRESSDPKLSAYNYSRVVPPFTAVPWVVSWIPSKEDVNYPFLDMIRVYAIRGERFGSKAPSGPYAPMTSAAGTELAPPKPDIDALMAAQEQARPDKISEITGQPRFDQMGLSNIRYIGKYMYKIFTNAADDMINIQRCTISKPEMCTTISANQPAVMNESEPVHYRIIAKPNAEFGFELDLARIAPEKLRELSY